MLSALQPYRRKIDTDYLTDEDHLILSVPDILVNCSLHHQMPMAPPLVDVTRAWQWRPREKLELPTLFLPNLGSRGP